MLMLQALVFLNSDCSISGMDGRTVGDFWRWAYSDILSIQNRSVFAEFIVGTALGVVGRPRIEWDATDLRYKGMRIEVESSAYLQSWPQKKLSTIQFDISKALSWDSETGASSNAGTRNTDLHVFCLYLERDKTKAKVLNVLKWNFYVVATKKLTTDLRGAKSISLADVKRAGIRCKFDSLKAAVDTIARSLTGHGRQE